MNGNGFTIEDSESSINTVYNLRKAKISKLKSDYHPYLKKINNE